MGKLILASVYMILLHTTVETSLKPWLVQRLGKVLYHILFSLLALLGMFFLVLTWQNAPYIELWGSPKILHRLALVSMPFAFYLFLAGLALPREPDIEKAPVLTITREPLFWGIALWAALHLFVNGDLAAVTFFGTFLFLALFGAIQRDQKRSRDPHWHNVFHQTSNFPFTALIKGQIAFDWKHFLKDQNLWIALLVYTLMLHLHPLLFGVRPW